MKYSVEYCCFNGRGRVRQNNEDNFYICGKWRPAEQPEGDILLTGTFPAGTGEPAAVYDGMGGEAAGEVASFLAASNTGPLSGRDPGRAMTEQLLKLNRAVCAYASENAISAMGTTAVSALFGRKKVTIANLGDSRAYLFREGSLVQRSVDHSAAVPSRRKAPLTQHLGLPEEEYLLEPSVSELACRDGDRFLLCSDGLTDMVPEARIREILAETVSCEDAVRALVTQAMENGGYDNITVLLCRVRRAPRRCIFAKRKKMER